MLSELTAADTVTWLSITVKTLTYATSLMAIGAPMLLAALRTLDEDERRSLACLGAVCAFIAIFLVAARLPIRASFLMGGTWEGATSVMMLGIVADSPLGTSALVRTIGLVLTIAVLLRHPTGIWIACLGAALAAASFGLRGHTLEEPRVILGILITVHILGLSFWWSALVPLIRAATHHPADRVGELAHEFGQRALWVVLGLAMAGGTMLVLFGVTNIDAIRAPYGQAFVVKLIVFVLVMGFAAANKLRRTPELRSGRLDAVARFKSSVRIEAALILLILVTTAVLTTMTAPPK
ncbi:MAG: CopD family protein [Pseudomonadota bacterium]